MSSIFRKGINFDFAGWVKQGSTFDPIITLTRASAKYNNSRTGTPLIELVAENKPGLSARQELWKAGSKNLLAYGNDFDHAVWYGIGDGFVPSKSVDAWVLTAPGSNAHIVQEFTARTSGVHTFSIEVAGVSAHTLNLTICDASFNILVNSQPALTTSLARYSVSYNMTAGTNYRVLLRNAGWDAAHPITVRNAQVEAASAFTSYESQPQLLQPGLSIDPAATNFCPKSQLPDVLVAQTTNLDGYASTTGPMGAGTNNVHQVTVATASDVNLRFGEYTSGISGEVGVGSVYIKRVDNAAFELALGYCETGYSQKMTIPAGAGWIRAYKSGTMTGHTYRFLDLNLSPGTYHICCVNIEAGSVPSSFILTGTGPVARAGDFVQIDNANLKSAECTYVIETDSNVAQQVVLNISNGTGKEIYIYNEPTAVILLGDGYNAYPQKTGSRARIAMCFTQTGMRISVNGNGVQSHNSGVFSPIQHNQLTIGGYRWNAGQFPGTVQTFMCLPHATDDLTLQAYSELSS